VPPGEENDLPSATQCFLLSCNAPASSGEARWQYRKMTAHDIAVRPLWRWLRCGAAADAPRMSAMGLLASLAYCSSALKSTCSSMSKCWLSALSNRALAPKAAGQERRLTAFSTRRKSRSQAIRSALRNVVMSDIVFLHPGKPEWCHRSRIGNLDPDRKVLSWRHFQHCNRLVRFSKPG
jgi:hypothetical protein